MTAHPIDTEALAKRAGHILFTQGPEQPAATARETCVLLDMLATAEHRATRAEAQAEARRIDNEYWKDLARRRTAQIKAAQDVLDRHAHYGLVEADDIRRALDGEQ